MEADYDVHSFGSLNQANDVFSRNMSSFSWQEVQEAESTSATDEIEAVVSLVVPIIFGFIVVIGLFGNALVVIVVVCNPQMRSTTNLLIINLAIADLLFIVFCVPFTAWDYAFPHWIFGDLWCRLVQYSIVVCAFASIYTLVLMSFDRFLAVVHPIASMSIRTQANATKAIVLTWISIMLVCSPTLFLYHEVHDTYGSEREQLNQCKFRDESEISKSAYQLTFFMLSFVLPIAIIFALYLSMLKRLWFGNFPGGHMSTESVRSKKRVTRLVVVVVLVFAGCWCPIQIVLLLKSYDAYTISNDSLGTFRLVVQITAHVLAYTNSCLNPILYAFLSENFRKAFHKVIVCWSSSASQTAATMTDFRGAQSDVERAAIQMTTFNNTCSSKKVSARTNDSV